MATSLTSAPNLKRLKKIRLLLLDVDGVLTDGTIFYQRDVGWTRFFHVRDGHGIKLAMKAGIEIGWISGGDSQDLKMRAEFLGITHFYTGDLDKMRAFDEILAKVECRRDEVAYVGDELFDIPILRQVGFAATVPDAFEDVKKHVHYVTRRPGGHGAVREVINGILRAQKKIPQLFDELLRNGHKTTGAQNHAAV